MLFDRKGVPVGIPVWQNGCLHGLVESERCRQAKGGVGLVGVDGGGEQRRQGVGLFGGIAVVAIAHLQKIPARFRQVDGAQSLPALVEGGNPVVEQIFVGGPDPHHEVEIGGDSADLELQFALMVHLEDIPVAVSLGEEGCLPGGRGVHGGCAAERVVGFAGWGNDLGCGGG